MWQPAQPECKPLHQQNTISNPKLKAQVVVVLRGVFTTTTNLKNKSNSQKPPKNGLNHFPKTDKRNPTNELTFNALP